MTLVLFTTRVGEPTAVVAFLTVIVIFWFLTSASVTLTRPSVLNWNVYVSPGFRTGAVNAGFFEVGWRFLESEFVQVIESPASTVITFGTKPALVMLTVFVAVSALGEASRDAASAGSSRSRFIFDESPSKR